MTPDERQLASTPDQAPRGPHWRRRLQVVLTLCTFILAVVVALNNQLLGALQGTVYVVLFFVTSVAGIEVFMVVGFVLALRALRQNPAFRRGNPSHSRKSVWGLRLARVGLVPLAIGYFGFIWYIPSLLEGWRPPNIELVAGIALLGAALVLFCIGILLIAVAFVSIIPPRIASRIRR